jgi:hypothetical protein
VPCRAQDDATQRNQAGNQAGNQAHGRDATRPTTDGIRNQAHDQDDQDDAQAHAWPRPGRNRCEPDRVEL